MNKWMRLTALVLALVLAVQCVPAQAAALTWAGEESGDEEGITVESGLLEVQPVAPEELPMDPEPSEPEQALMPASIGEGLSWSVENGVLTITGTGAMADFSGSNAAPWNAYEEEITEIVIGEGITAVGNYAFDYHEAVTSVSLPESLERIGKAAFMACYALETVEIPDSVTTIEDYAFEACTSLREVKLSAGLTQLEYRLFRLCTSLEAIEVPEGITYMGENVFDGCSSLTQVELPDTLTNIPTYAFQNCTALESIVIPDSVTTGGSYSFQGCTALTDVTLPEGLTTIFAGMFFGCTALETIGIPASVSKIDKYAFQNCTALAEVDIPANVSNIRESAFDGCTALAEITLREGLTMIESYAFRNCDALTSAALPAGLESIGSYLFSYCDSLKELTLPGDLTYVPLGILSSCTALEEYVIPDTITRIGSYAFTSCTALTSVTIPESVTEIDSRAFGYCSALETIDLPDGLTSLGNNAFYNCTALREITIPEGITVIDAGTFGYTALTGIDLPAGVTTIGGSAFAGCTGLESIAIPAGVTTIGGAAFSQCSALETITFAEGCALTSIGTQTFEKCSALKEIVLPQTLTSIGGKAFRLCSALQKLAIPASVTTIQTNAFELCTALKTVTFGENSALATLGNYAFRQCYALEDIRIPGSVKNIGAYAFQDCGSLGSVELGEGTTGIGAYAFSSTAIGELVIPDTVTTIQQNAFQNCVSLRSVTLSQNLTTLGSNAFCNCSALEAIDIPGSVAAVGSYAFSGCSALGSVELHEGTTSIGSEAFAACAALTSIDIPDSVTSIGTYAFRDCVSLESARLPEGLTAIAGKLFSRCTALKQIRIPDSADSIGNGAFEDCAALTEVVMGSGITSIGGNAFNGCAALTEAILPEGLKTIDGYAFYDCSSLQRVSLPQSLNKLGSYTFGNCSSLIEADLPWGLDVVEAGLFRGCAGLKRVSIPDSVASIGDYAFYGCAVLEAVEIPASVTSIGYEAFYDCAALKAVELPDSVTAIGSGAFCGCTALESVLLPGNLPTIESYTFQDCSALKRIEIPESVTGIGYCAFGACPALAEAYIPASVTSISYSAFQGWRDLTIYTYPDAYAWTFALEQGIPVVNILDNVNLTVTVLDPEGNALTEGFSVEWYRTGSDQVLATGSTLRGVSKQDLSYAYHVVLDEALSYVYQRHIREDVQIVDDNYDLIFQLEPIAALQLGGLVADAGGQPIENARVELTQVYNDLYEKTITAATGADGSFSVTADAVPTRITIRAEGFYSIELSRDLSDRTGSLRLEDTVLTALPADRITLKLELTEPHEPGSAAAALDLPGETELEFALYNVTAQRAITDFTAELPWLILGSTEAQPGDTIRIQAFDKAGTMTADPVTLTLDENRVGEARISFLRHGVFTIDQVLGNEENVLMVFDDQGVLVDSSEVFSGYTSRNLPEGSYQLVLLEKTGLLRGAATLGRLEELGLSAGTDYVLADVSILDGLITHIESVSVPALDESLLEYIDRERTVFTLGRRTVYPEQPVTLRLEYALNPRFETDGEKVLIDLPAGVRVSPEGVYLNGRACTYTQNGSTVVIPTGMPSGSLCVYVSAYDVGDWHISGSLSFTSGGGQVLQPLGQSRLSCTVGELLVPLETSRPLVAASGITIPGRQVTVYLNNEPVASTTANAVGSWDLSIPLKNTYRVSYHEIYAEIAGQETGERYRTSSQVVRFDATVRELSTVTMYNVADYAQRTVFNYLNPGETPKYMILMSGSNFFTFTVRFTGEDASNLRNVKVVFEDLEGDVRKIRCTYKRDLDAWVCSCYCHEIEDVPAAVGVTYENVPTSSEPIIDSDFVEDFKEELLQVEEDHQAWLDSFVYVDDGSTDNMDFEELANLIDEELSQIDQDVAEFEYTLDAGLEEMGSSFSETEDTRSMTVGDITVDTTMITLEEVDEASLLAEGYEKIMSTDGSCLYRKIDGDVVSYVEPVNKTKLTTVCRSESSAAETFGTSSSNEFEQTRKAIKDAIYAFRKVHNAFEEIQRLTGTLFDHLRNKLDDLERKKVNVEAHAEELFAKFEDAVKRGTSAEEMAKYRQHYLRQVGRVIRATEKIRKQEEAINALEKAKKLIKALPFLSILFNLQDLLKFNDDLEALYKKLPDVCPADPAGLEAIRTEIRNLTIFVRTKIIVDIVVDIGAIVGAFSIGVLGAPVTLGGSLVLSVTAVVLIIAASVAADYAFEKYREIKWNEILDMMELLQCEDPEPEDEQQIQMLPANVFLDPSGYVYEAVPSNRVEGVRAEVFYRDGDGDISWDAENYDQQNPVYTNAAGMFRWDVPVGQWLVKFSKDGYYDTDSRGDPAADDEGYLPVPPPQMEVNTAIVSKAAPTVESVQIYDDEVLLIFSQYMQPGTVDGQSVTVTCGGTQVRGTITASNAEWNYERTEQYATVFRFVPDQALSGTARITVSGAVNYAGTAMEEAYQLSGTVNVRPEGLTAANTVSMAMGTEHQIEVQILPAAAGAGKTITVQALSGAIVRVDTPSVTADENGKAVVTVYGELPGVEGLTFRLEGTDLTAETQVQVGAPEGAVETCEKVTASIPNGSTVPAGTELELYTATEGAQIYYTLDGTCPCVVDSPSRILYTGPIVLNEDTFLIAYAVKEGALDSPTAGFVYTVQRICTHENTVRTGTHDASCTENGFTGDLSCADCGEVLEEGAVIPAVGHAWDEGVVTREPTEDAEGEMCYTCTVCGETRTEPIPKLDHVHSYSAVVTAPTCTERGYTTYACSCGESYVDDYVDALGHSFSEWSVVRQPTGTKEGLEERSCTRCGHTEQRAIPVLENPFTDVTESDYFFEPVLWAVYRGITNGTTPTRFAPDKECTRAQVVTFLWRAAGSPAPKTTNHPFRDIVEGEYYYDAVLWAVENEITNGVTATAFGPDRSCTRAQVVTFLWRAMKKPAPTATTHPFTDVVKGEYYYDAVLWAVEHEITNGIDYDVFGTDRTCTRGQVVTFLHRTYTIYVN